MWGLNTIVRLNEHAAAQAAVSLPERDALAKTVEGKPLPDQELEPIKFHNPGLSCDRCA